MAFRNLVDYVLEEIAIDGEEGTTIPQLFEYVKGFYGKNPLERHDISSLCKSPSSENAAQDKTTSFPTEAQQFGEPNLNEKFQEYVWELLKQESDFNVGRENEGGQMLLSEIVADLKLANAQKKGEGAVADPEEVPHGKWKVYAAEDRRWRALTGHGVDYKRVPNALFKLLEIIGRHREQGLIQPELTRISGQDKKSVPPRTTTLQNLGYIEKINVLARSVNTSKLTLSKFAVQRDEKLRRCRDARTGELSMPKAEWTGPTIHTEELVKTIIQMLKAAKNQVLMHSDLKRKLGMDKSSFHWKNLSRILRRIEKYGVLKRIRVPLKLNRKVRKQGSKEVDVTEQCHARCIKFLRDMTVQDWRKLAVFSKAGATGQAEYEYDAAGSDDEGDKADKDGEEVDPQAVTKLAEADVKDVEEALRDVPQWHTNYPLMNIIYDLVHSSGTEGISSMDLILRMVGPFYYRPMDQVFHRMTDFPTISQPIQLRHLAIIRETSISGRSTHYRYFTYPNHQQLVKEGFATDPWDVQSQPGRKKGQKSMSSGDATSQGSENMLVTDQYGFSAANTSRLLNQNGSSTLAESAAEIMKKDNVSAIENQFIVQIMEDGQKVIDWRNSGLRAGRPRKYEKGKEPYLAGRRRAAAARDKATQETQALEGENTVSQTPKKHAREEPGDELPEKEAVPARRGRPPKKCKTEADGEPPVPKKRGRPPKKRRGVKTGNAPQPTSQEQGPTQTEAASLAPEDRPSEAEKDSLNEIAPLQSEQVAIGQDDGDVGDSGRPAKKRKIDTSPTPEPAPQEPESTQADDAGLPFGDSVQNPPEAEAVLAASEPARVQKDAVAGLKDATSPANKRGRRTKRKYTRTTRTMKSSSTPLPAGEGKTGSDMPGSVSPISFETPAKSAPLTELVTGRKTRSSCKRSASPITTAGQKRLKSEPLITHDAVQTRSSGESADIQPQPSGVQIQEPTPEPLKTSGEGVDSEIPSDTSKTEPNDPSLNMGDATTAMSPGENRSNSESTGLVDTGKIETEPSALNVNGTTIEIERLDVEGNESYGSIGGMLALGRQQVVLELLSEHNGVFPGGNELRHAFNKRYQKRNPKAGMSVDRRLIRGVVQALQYKGKVNQITFSFQNRRGLAITKKIIADAQMPLDDPRVAEMTRDLIAADGNLWFPPGVELHENVAERFRQPPVWSLPRPCAIEGIEFERVVPDSVIQARERKAEKKAERAAMASAKAEARARRRYERANRIIVSGQNTQFTEEQKEAARQRKAELKADKALQKMNREYQMKQFADEPLPVGGKGGLPKKIWWNQFVDRDVTAPTDPATFFQEVQTIQSLEEGEAKRHSEEVRPASDEGLVIINHFAPQTVVGGSPKVDLNVTIKETGDGTAAIVPAPDKAASTIDTGQANNDEQPSPEEMAIMFAKRRKRRRRAPGTAPKAPSRREKEMQKILQTAFRVPEDSIGDVPTRRTVRRTHYRIAKEDEDTLLVAVIILRTIFGGRERKIHWGVVHTVLPQHEVTVLQRRWPAVRDAHKKHLKKLQTEFEEAYLDAYANGQLPVVNVGDVSSFDLPYHIEWFREHLRLPEPDVVPELSSEREAFKELYDVCKTEPHAWRSDFHSPTYTLGQRGNQLVCNAYEIPLDAEPSTESRTALDYVESVIKANIITDLPDYDPVHAFKILHSQPEELVDKAFYNLTTSRIIAHKKEKGRVMPGRNYEFTDRFHYSLRSTIDADLLFQAAKFNKMMEASFEEDKAIKLDPFSGDGSVACIFDLLANRKIRLEKENYRAHILGLIEGYETRTMNKELIDFSVIIKPSVSYSARQAPETPPAIPVGNIADSGEPIRIWCDINGKLVHGMWVKALATVLCQILNRPGIQTEEIAKIVQPGLSFLEVKEATGWLAARGAIGSVGDGLFAKRGYFSLFTDNSSTI